MVKFTYRFPKVNNLEFGNFQKEILGDQNNLDSEPVNSGWCSLLHLLSIAKGTDSETNHYNDWFLCVVFLLKTVSVIEGASFFVHILSQI